MDLVTLKQINNLFWLGRYAARVDLTLEFLGRAYDRMIDGGEFDYKAFCHWVRIPCPYLNSREFWRRYPFDKKLPSSLAAAADTMLGNGMVLRDKIGSETLSYLQMAVYALDKTSVEHSPRLGFQKVRDCLLAFAGSAENNINERPVRDYLKSGVVVERLSLVLSLGATDRVVRREVSRLLVVAGRIRGTNQEARSILEEQHNTLIATGRLSISRESLRDVAEHLFDI